MCKRKNRRRRPKLSQVLRVVSSFLLALICWLILLNLTALQTDPLKGARTDFQGGTDTLPTANLGQGPITSSSGAKDHTPRLWLHIGPHKTATTSIQCALHRYRRDLEETDSIVFLGKVDSKYCKSRSKGEQDMRIQNLDTCAQDETCWTGLVREWNERRQHGFDMVMSKESLSDWASPEHSTVELREQFWPRMAEALHGWNVTVLLTHRRYFEWLPSAFNQNAYHLRLQSRQPWPVVGDRMGTFQETLADVLSKGMAPPYPFLDSLLGYPFPSSWGLHIMDLHKSPDIVRSLFCETLQANHSCSIYERLPSSRESPADDLVYDFLNVQAIQWGWTKAGRRGAMMRTTRAFFKITFQHSVVDLPHVCPSPDLLESFLARSIDMERKILGSVNVNDHSLAFWRNSQQSFCSVNAKDVLSTNVSIWKKFYQSLS